MINAPKGTAPKAGAASSNMNTEVSSSSFANMNGMFMGAMMLNGFMNRGRRRF